MWSRSRFGALQVGAVAGEAVGAANGDHGGRGAHQLQDTQRQAAPRARPAHHVLHRSLTRSRRRCRLQSDQGRRKPQSEELLRVNTCLKWQRTLPFGRNVGAETSALMQSAGRAIILFRWQDGWFARDKLWCEPSVMASLWGQLLFIRTTEWQLSINFSILLSRHHIFKNETTVYSTLEVCLEEPT